MKARMLGAFLYASQECPGADFETEGGPVEFKTSRSVGKVNGLLVNASKKFGTYPGEAKVVVILASSGCRTRRRRRLGQQVALPEMACSMGLWCLGKMARVSIKNGRRYSAPVPNTGVLAVHIKYTAVGRGGKVAARALRACGWDPTFCVCP